MLFATGSEGQNRTAQSEFGRIPALRMFTDKEKFPTTLKEDMTGFILPAINYAMPVTDTMRCVSYIGYRTLSSEIKAPFSGWFSPLGVKGTFTDKEGKQVTYNASGMYSYFGKSMSTFISPTLAGNADPIVELRRFINTLAKEGDKTYLPLREKKVFPEKCALPSMELLFLVNALCTGSNKYDPEKDVLKVRQLLIPPKAMDRLQTSLNEMRPADMPQPVDPENPRYLLGDVTNPKAALKFTVRAWTNGQDKGKELVFGDLVAVGNNFEYKCEKGAITDEQLAQRVDLSGATDELYIPTYDEIVMLLLAEGDVPRELFEVSGVAAKCEHFPSKEEVAAYLASAEGTARVNTQQPQPCATQAAAPAAAPAAYQQPAPAPAAYQQPAPAPAPQQAAPAPQPAAPVQQAAPAYQQQAPAAPSSFQAAAPAAAPAPVPDPSDQIPGIGGHMTEAEKQELERLRGSIATLTPAEIKRLGELMTLAQTAQ